MAFDTKRVQLVDDGGNPLGTALKSAVHGIDTPLHLAFSCHVYSRAGGFLMTRRALAKRTWPGVWTNAFCGHPAPGEPIEDAVRRHARNELGLELAELAVVLPEFRYRARDASGIVENEICPVFRALAASEISPSPDEVCETQWTDVESVRTAVTVAPYAFSPWLRMQLQELQGQTEST